MCPAHELNEYMRCPKLGTMLAFIVSSCVNPPEPTVEQLRDVVSNGAGTASARLLRGLVNSPENSIEEFRDFYLKQDGANVNFFQYKTSAENANTVLFFNTLGEPNSSSTEFCEWMTKLGYNVIMADFPGTGKSEGDRGVFTVEQNMRTIDIAVEHAKKEFGGKVIFIGSSHGGEMGYHYACSANSDKIDCYFLHGVFIPSLDIDPYNLGVKMLVDDKGPMSGQQLIKARYPDKIPLGVLVKPENFYVPLEEIIKLREWESSNKSMDELIGLNRAPLYDSLEAFKQISDDPLYVTEINTDSFLAYARRKPDRALTKNVPVVLLASEGDKVVDFKTRAIHVYTELRKMSDKVDLHLPGTVLYDQGNSAFIPHMAFDTHARVMGNELDVLIRGGYLAEESVAKTGE